MHPGIIWIFLKENNRKQSEMTFFFNFNIVLNLGKKIQTREFVRFQMFIHGLLKEKVKKDVGESDGKKYHYIVILKFATPLKANSL